MGKIRKSRINPDGLTPKQQKFANTYLETGNGAQAARTAYNLTSDHPNLPSVIGNEVLRNPKVEGYIVTKLTHKDLTPQLILNKLLESVESLNPAEKLKSLELLGKHLRMFNEKLDATNQLDQVKSIGWASSCSNPSCECSCHGSKEEK